MDLVDNRVLTADHQIEDPHKAGQFLPGYSAGELAKLVGDGEHRIKRLLKPMGFVQVRKQSSRRVKGPSGRKRKVVLPARWSPPEPGGWRLNFVTERRLLEAGKSPGAIQYARRCGRIPEEVLHVAVKQFEGAESLLAQKGVLIKAVNEAMEAGRTKSQEKIDELSRELDTLRARNESLETTQRLRESYGEITCDELNEALGRPGGNKSALLKRTAALGKSLRQSRDEVARLTKNGQPEHAFRR